MSEPLNCPHCASVPVIRLMSPSSDQKPIKWAICLECGAGLPVDKWNRRTAGVDEVLERVAIRFDEMDSLGGMRGAKLVRSFKSKEGK
jgi:hypothetical protein